MVWKAQIRPLLFAWWSDCSVEALVERQVRLGLADGFDQADRFLVLRNFQTDQEVIPSMSRRLRVWSCINQRTLDSFGLLLFMLRVYWSSWLRLLTVIRIIRISFRFETPRLSSRPNYFYTAETRGTTGLRAGMKTLSFFRWNSCTTVDVCHWVDWIPFVHVEYFLGWFHASYFSIDLSWWTFFGESRLKVHTNLAFI